MGEYLYQDLTYQIRGACYEVYNQLGPGFKETVYHHALAVEFRLRNVPFVEKKRLSIRFKGAQVGTYEPDFIVDGKVLIEVKAVPIMPQLHELQLRRYLAGTDLKLGLLVNFGAEKLEIRRRIYDEKRKTIYQRKSALESA